MSKKDVLPKWANCSKKFDKGEPLNPVEDFVYDNEPFGSMQVGFRNKLIKALRYFAENNKSIK